MFSLGWYPKSEKSSVLGGPNPISWEMGRRWFLELGLPGLVRGGLETSPMMALQNVAGKHVVTRGYTIYKYSNTCWSKENMGIWCFLMFFIQFWWENTWKHWSHWSHSKMVTGWWRNWGFLAWQFLNFAVEAAKRGLRKLGKTGDSGTALSDRSLGVSICFHKWGDPENEWFMETSIWIL